MAERLRVAIVDDDDAWAAMAWRALVAAFDLERARTVAELLEIAHVVTPAVVLLDLRLPDAGDYLSHVMRICARFPESAVIVTTAIEDEELALETLRAGAQDYIVKEVSVWATMPAKIRSAYARKRATVREVVEAAEKSMAGAPLVDTDKIAAVLEERMARRFKVRTGVHEVVPPGPWWRRVTAGQVYDFARHNARFTLGLLAAAGAFCGVRETQVQTARDTAAEVETLTRTVEHLERALESAGRGATP